MEQDFPEIDNGLEYVGFPEARKLIFENIPPLEPETIPIGMATGRIAAENVTAPNSYPSADVSLKDGFAVRSSDVDQASIDTPVTLEVTGSVFAGSRFSGQVRRGCAVRICSGAPIPSGSDAVVAGEFCRETSPGEVSVRAIAEPGRNILEAGSEITAGTVIVGQGAVLQPGKLGLTAAAGIGEIRIFRRPRIAVIGLGDELVAPGGKLKPDQIYASNLITLGAWLASCGIECTTSVVQDSTDSIESEILQRCRDTDALITSGGAWGSERDLVVGVLDSLRWRKIFHRVRMGPGKGTAFGLLMNRPVFCLPGGPASNEMSFLQLALPGILRMAGDTRPPLPSVPARLLEDVNGRNPNWTEYMDAVITRSSNGSFDVVPYRNRSRLQAIASANSLVCIPEGMQSLQRGDTVPVQVLADRADLL